MTFVASIAEFCFMFLCVLFVMLRCLLLTGSITSGFGVAVMEPWRSEWAWPKWHGWKSWRSSTTRSGHWWPSWSWGKREGTPRYERRSAAAKAVREVRRALRRKLFTEDPPPALQSQEHDRGPGFTQVERVERSVADPSNASSTDMLTKTTLAAKDEATDSEGPGPSNPQARKTKTTSKCKKEKSKNTLRRRGRSKKRKPSRMQSRMARTWQRQPNRWQPRQMRSG